MALNDQSALLPALWYPGLVSLICGPKPFGLRHDSCHMLCTWTAQHSCLACCRWLLPCLDTRVSQQTCKHPRPGLQSSMNCRSSGATLQSLRRGCTFTGDRSHQIAAFEVVVAQWASYLSLQRRALQPSLRLVALPRMRLSWFALPVISCLFTLMINPGWRGSSRF